MDALNNTLQVVFGHEAFKTSQQPLVKAISDGKSVLGILPTGEGKSVCYQVPALIQPGITIVISPLLALIRDQVLTLQAKGVQVAAITSNTSAGERDRIFANLATGQLKILYVAPELYARSDFLGRFGYTMPIRTVVFDEAHCLSQWGQDFRPAYVRAAQLTATLSKRYSDNQLPPIQRVAVTATATRKIQAHICHLLAIPADCIIRGDLRRPNLRLHVHPVTSQQQRTETLLSLVSANAKSKRPTIVYAHTRNTVDSLVRSLRVVGVSALGFHAGLSRDEKDVAQQRFSDDSISVIVATVAFGMGVDKPNVRSVIHFNAPHSIEDYYQQIGRAGRDGYPSDCFLLFNKHDELEHVTQMMDNCDPNASELTRSHAFLYEMYASQGQAIRVHSDTMAGAVGIAPSKAKRILEQLIKFNVIKELSPNDYAVRALSSTAIFNAIDTVNESKRRSVELMQEFGNEAGCLMQFIMDYFGQPGTGACERCCNCTSSVTPSKQAPNKSEGLRANPVYQDLMALRSRIGRATNIPNFAIMSDAAMKKITLEQAHEVDQLVEAGMNRLHAKLYAADIRAIVLGGDMALGNDTAPAPQSAVSTPDDSVAVVPDDSLNPSSR